MNLYGHMPEYDDLVALGIPVIEDAAESIGSRYKDRLSDTFGVTSCFSFHGSRTLTTGEGGMLVTDDDYIYESCMILRDHGRKSGDILFQNQEIGYKYKMSNLQATLGLAQLERIHELVDKKRQTFHWCKEEFQNCGFISLNPDHSDVYNSYWMVTAIFSGHRVRDKFYYIKNSVKPEYAHGHFLTPLSSLGIYEKIKAI